MQCTASVSETVEATGRSGKPSRAGRAGRTFHLLLSVGSLLFLATVSAQADDVGLVSARLIERDGCEYVIESDVPPLMVGMLGKPILPDHFTLDAPEFRRQGVMVTVRYTFRGDVPLTSDDVLLLPWSRMGVILNARWLDGTQANVLFARRPEGIPIEIRLLRPEEKSPGEVFREQGQASFVTALKKPGHWLLILSLVILVPSRKLLVKGFFFLAGLALALLVVDFGIPPVPLLLADSLVLIAALLMARAAATPRVSEADDSTEENKPPISTVDRFGPVLLAIGLVCGLAHAAELARDGAAAGHTPVALSGYWVGTSAFYVLAAVTFACVSALRKVLPTAHRLTAFALGSMAIAGLLQVVAASGESIQRAETEKRFQLFPKTSQAGSARGGAAPAPRKLTDPFVVFLTIEPYEVRCEVLASAETLVGHLGFPPGERKTIEVQHQTELKERALAFLEQGTQLRINKAEGVPNSRRADFLTLGIGGALTRSKPVPEPFDTAILGLTFVYSTPGPPDELDFEWSDLPQTVQSIPVTLTDPLEVTGLAVSAESKSIAWKNELGSFKPPEVKAVEVSRPQWAFVSAILTAIALVVASLGTSRWKASWPLPLAYACLIAGVALYPIVRVPLTIPMVGQTAIPNDQAASTVEGLLTNVYRSFSYRDESDIYDHLAVSVTGDQLTETYLEQRRALELENRGGARARVDQVEVRQVDSVTAEDEGGLAISASWDVSGSVNHFGHTHYRRNRYNAILHIRSIEGVWKISSIEVQEEQRVL